MLSGRAASVKWKLKTVGLSVQLNVPPPSLSPLPLSLSLPLFPVDSGVQRGEGRNQEQNEHLASSFLIFPALLHLFYMIIKKILTLAAFQKLSRTRARTHTRWRGLLV